MKLNKESKPFSLEQITEHPTEYPAQMFNISNINLYKYHFLCESFECFNAILTSNTIIGNHLEIFVFHFSVNRMKN